MGKYTFPLIVKRSSIAFLSFLLSLIALAFIFQTSLLGWAGKALVRDDYLKRADALVVLAGDSSGERMDAAIKLLKGGYGKFLVFSGGPLYWKVSYAEIFLQQLREAGVDREKAVWSDEKLQENSTLGEAKVNIRLLKEKGVRSFILVTSDYHSARAGRVYERLLIGTGIEMRVHAVKGADVDLGAWWTDRAGAKIVFLEWEKTIWYFLR